MSETEDKMLAILGGKPAFRKALHVGAPNLGDRASLHKRIDQMLDGGRLTNRGPFVRELEQRIGDLLQVKHCIAMCNGTVALEIAIRALGLSGEVIVPAFTFIATAHALQWQQITPVFCDIEADNCTIDPQRIEELITPRTTGILGVHLWGRPCQVKELTRIARKNRLSLLFDAAHSFATTYRGRMIGNFGDAEVFSFHATKFFNTFEGGAVTTNNDELARRIRLMQNFGFAGLDNVVDIGTNGKMNDASAAMGLTSLECIDTFIARNKQNYLTYQRAIAGIKGVRLMPYSADEQYNYQYISVEVDEPLFGLSRDELVVALRAENVLARRYFYPGCHRMEPYRSYFPHSHLLLPVTEQLKDRMISLPTGTAVQDEQICSLVRLIERMQGNAVQIKQQLMKRNSNHLQKPGATAAGLRKLERNLI